jgi:hypothetical protein
MTFGKTTYALVFTALTATAGGMYAGYSMADQPRMHSALDHLQAAENDLQAADNDKGGHRQRALELTRKAIAQVREGMRHDRRY